MSFENIFTHGNLVDVTVHMWTAERKLQPEDLGLKDTFSKTNVFALGHKKLVPHEVIKKFENLAYRARYMVDRYGYMFEFGSIRFIPKKRMVEFAAEMAKLIQEYDKAADDLVLNYTKYRLEVRKDFVDAAHLAYQRAKQLGGYRGSEDDFVNKYLARIEESYPEASILRARFGMNYTVFTAGLPNLTIGSGEEQTRSMQVAYAEGLTRKASEFVNKVVTEQRNRVRIALENLVSALKNEIKFHSLSLKAVDTMIVEYEKMDIVGDEALIKTLKDFKARVLDRYTSKDFRSSKSLRTGVSDEAHVIMTNLCNPAVIEALATQYRQRINL